MIYLAACLVVIYLSFKLLPLLSGAVVGTATIVSKSLNLEENDCIKKKILRDYENYSDFKENYSGYNNLSPNAKKIVEKMFLKKATNYRYEKQNHLKQKILNSYEDYQDFKENYGDFNKLSHKAKKTVKNLFLTYI